MSNMPFSIRMKILLLVIGLLVGVGGAVAFYVKTEFSEKLTDELLKRGISVARQLAENGSSAMVTDDIVTLARLAHSSQGIAEDIVYSFFVASENNQVLAHSFGEYFPIDLLQASPETYSDETHVRQLLTSGGIVYDITVPVISSQVGWVRVGISANSVTMAADSLIRQMLTAGSILLLAAIIAAIPLARAVSNPITRLTQAVESLSRGERTDPVKIRSNDEIGRLASAFNVMADNLIQAEEQLANQVRFLETLLADIPEPVFYKDMEGHLLGYNHAFESFFEVSGKSLINQTSYEYRPAEEAAIHIARDRDVLEGNKRVSYEIRVTKTDGILRDVIFHKAPIRDENNNVTGLIGVLQDITEEREASRLKSEFVTTAAHEFQTPLASILGFSELILENGEATKDDLPEFLQLIFNKASFLSQLVDEMLSLSRIESGRGIALNKSECTVNNELAEIVSNFRLLYSGYNFKIEHPPESKILIVDRERMGQVVDNLLQNAVKYSANGSTITLKIINNPEDCQVAVSDQGIGMTAEQIKHATKKFYRGDTSDTAPGGTGLGLFISKSIVEAHGGILEIESQEGKGTTVSFRIPFEQPDRELHVPKSAIQVSHVEH